MSPGRWSWKNVRARPTNPLRMDVNSYLNVLFVEAAALAALFLIGLATYRRSIRLIHVIERALARLARRRALSGVLIALFAFALSASLSLLGRMPEPEVHDEFSYLLAADTFTHGRLSNPPHPMWVHFETFHVIFHPTYASKYPPGQGLTLALGQILTGYPIVGVWLSTAVASAAVYWMLLAWVPAWIALLGGIMTALHPGVQYWSQLYWGGQLGMIGGALLFGALRRILRRPGVMDSILLGIGVAILANSRPYEGLLVAVPIFAALLIGAVRNRPLTPNVFRRTVLPIAVVLLVTLFGMGFYNLRVTGNPLRLPYMAHEEEYAVYPFFIWQQPRPVPTYRHKVLSDYHLVWEGDWYEPTKSLSGLINVTLEKLRRPWIFFQGIHAMRLVLAIPLFFLPWSFTRRRLRFVCAGAVFFAAGVLLISWGGARLWAPITGALILIYLDGFRRMRLLRIGGFQIGRLLAWSIVFVAIGTFGLELRQRMQDDAPRWYFERARIRDQLEKDGGRHLILVRYGPDHSPLLEWVYNAADIDGSKVVWAREMNPSADKELLDYFKDRKLWLLEVYDDTQLPRLIPLRTSKP